MRPLTHLASPRDGAGFFFADSRLSDLPCVKARIPGDAIIPQKPKKRRTRPVVRVQYGALPYRFTPMAALEILIVTTRQSRRWIVPKGWPIKRLTPSKSAAREAFEEAGVRGKIGARAIGNFTYKKTAGQTGADARLRGQDFPAAGPKAKRDLARTRAARGSVGRSGEGDFAHPRAGAEGDRGEVCKTSVCRGEQTHLLTGAQSVAKLPSPI